MSSSEEELRPAFAEAGWTGRKVKEDEEYEYFEDKGPLEFVLSREGDAIVGRVQNSGETVVLESRPVVSFVFAPAELMKFDMPSVLIPKKEGREVTLKGRASTDILHGTWKGNRWVFQWASEVRRVWTREPPRFNGCRRTPRARTRAATRCTPRDAKSPCAWNSSRASRRWRPS